ncbi:hypothetical protein LTR84_004406 [Exophiala bonariae]|uniref:Uncharacterized protein n=1 Tax=Exophiala bonariae TaxID=1690606 RepID=A0AAV9N928_9EURO|nr:hypothetical protein LTR84_004406 [Exophiala bonariae]
MGIPPARRATRRATAKGEADLISRIDEPDVWRKKRGRAAARKARPVTPTTPPPRSSSSRPRTPAAPKKSRSSRKSPVAAIPITLTKAPSTQNTANALGAGRPRPKRPPPEDPNEKHRPPNPFQPRNQKRRHRSLFADQAYRPPHTESEDPPSEPIRRARSPNKDPSYRPSRLSLEEEEFDHLMSTERRPENRRIRTSGRDGNATDATSPPRDDVGHRPGTPARDDAVVDATSPPRHSFDRRPANPARMAPSPMTLNRDNGDVDISSYSWYGSDSDWLSDLDYQEALRRNEMDIERDNESEESFDDDQENRTPHRQDNQGFRPCTHTPSPFKLHISDGSSRAREVSEERHQHNMDINRRGESESQSENDQENRPPSRHTSPKANAQGLPQFLEGGQEFNHAYADDEDDDDLDEDEQDYLDQQEEHGYDEDSENASPTSSIDGQEDQADQEDQDGEEDQDQDGHNSQDDHEDPEDTREQLNQEYQTFLVFREMLRARDGEGHDGQDDNENLEYSEEQLCQEYQEFLAFRAIKAGRADPAGPPAPAPADQATHQGVLRPMFPVYDRQRLQKQAVFRNIKTNNPGHTNHDLRAILKRPPAEGDTPASFTVRTPKRARFAPTTVGGDDQNPTFGGAVAVETSEDILERILIAPERLSLVQMHIAFTGLQKESLQFAKKFFNFELSDEQIDAWPLPMLKYEYFGLKEIAKYLTDAEGSTWRELFTTPESRIALIHGTIGEYLKHHVFKATAFSFTGQLRERFEDLDRKYINHDAFVRNKKRASLLAKITRESNGFWLAHRENMFNASSLLAAELLTLFEPLLPPPMFDPLVSSRILLQDPSKFSFTGSKLSTNDQRDADFLWSAMVHDLRTLVYKAAALHLSIRLSGHNGTNIRFLHHVEKGSPYHGPETMKCVNKRECHAQNPRQQRTDDDEMKIRMTCWSHIEAVVPHGVDFEEYQQMQAEMQEQEGIGSQDTRTFEQMERYFGDRFPHLPPELTRRDSDEEDWPREDGTQIDYEFFRAQLREEQRSREAEGDGEEPEHMPSPPEQQRGSYVTFYRSIVRSHVYCSWGKRGQNPRAAPSLDEAVDEARRAAGGFYTLQDNFVKGRDAAAHLADTSIDVAAQGLDVGLDAMARKGTYSLVLAGTLAYALHGRPQFARTIASAGHAISDASSWTQNTLTSVSESFWSAHAETVARSQAAYAELEARTKLRAGLVNTTTSIVLAPSRLVSQMQEKFLTSLSTSTASSSLPAGSVADELPVASSTVG